MQDAEYALTNLPQGQTAAEANVARFYRGNPSVVPVALAAVTAPKAQAVNATANHGRWIVECPSGDGGAQFASRLDRRFMCQECLNAAAGGKWLPVNWPTDLEAIDAALDARRDIATRNWIPGITAADIRIETARRR